MIYVMRSAGFDENNNFTTLIKIGYTGEKSKKSRFDLYLTENPTIKVLYLIPYGTTRDEKNLHRHFKQYLLYGNEWFKDVPEIIEFFENHKTKESLKELEMWKLSSVQKNESSKNRKSNKDKIPLINVSVNIILKGEIDRKRIKELERYLWYRLDSFWDVIREEFGEYEEEIKRGIESTGNIVVDIDNSDRLKEEYQYIMDNFNNDNNFERRMKLLCDANKKYPSLFFIYGPYLQNIIPLHYQNYINLLGFERIRALGYKESDIQKEIASNRTLNSSTSITSLFSIGSKYTKKQIKEMLREFYEENNITKTPKASDLEGYYNLKACKVKIDDKWENGFEIVGLKSGDV